MTCKTSEDHDAWITFAPHKSLLNATKASMCWNESCPDIIIGAQEDEPTGGQEGDEDEDSKV